jgi:DNA-binding XRE family transcriptional regulator
MTQAELATAIGLTATSIARMERGEQPIMRTTELAVRFLLVMESKKRKGKKK